MDQYLVVYERHESGGGGDIYGTRLAPTGDVIPPEIGIAGWPGGEGSPTIASCRDSYLVAWIGYAGTRRDPDSEIYARAVSGDGTVGSIVTDLPGNFISERAPSVACTEESEEYLVAWQPIFADSSNYGVVGTFLNPNAAPQAGAFSIFAPTVGTALGYAHPSLAFGFDTGALVVWEADRSPNGALLDMSGRLVGNRLFADSFDSGDLFYWSESH